VVTAGAAGTTGTGGTAGSAGAPVETGGTAGAAGSAGGPVGVGGTAGSAGGEGGAAGACLDYAANPTTILIDSITIGPGAGGAGGAGGAPAFSWDFASDLDSWDYNQYVGNVNATATQVSTGDDAAACAGTGCAEFSVELCYSGDSAAFVHEFGSETDLTGQTITVMVYKAAGSGGGIQLFIQGTTTSWANSGWTDIYDDLDGEGWVPITYDLSGLDVADVNSIGVQVLIS
jgi:hypothetical protein